MAIAVQFRRPVLPPGGATTPTGAQIIIEEQLTRQSTLDRPPNYRARHSISFVVVAVVFTLLAVRQHFFVDRYSVNVMFGDQ
jgi:hypothetical protein